MRKREWKYLLAIGVVCLIIGGIWDLQISHVLYHADSLYGKFFEAFAVFPAVLIASFCSMGLFVTRKKDGNVKSRILAVFYFFLTAGLIYTASTLPGWYLKNWTWTGRALIIVFALAEYKLALYCKESNEKEFRKAAKIGILLLIFSFLVYNGAKFIWGRERYRHMVKVGTFAGFSRWFLPQGIAFSNDFMSFPSGHSANAAIVVWITLLPGFLPFFRGKENFLKVISYGWLVLSMCSRIVIGAHFLSDVTMGAGITLAIFYLLCKKIKPSVFCKNKKD